MSVAFAEKLSLADVPAPSGAAGRIVLSRLPRGETEIVRPGLSLKVVLRGEERYVIDGRNVTLTAGNALLVHPGERTEVVLPGRERTLGLCFYFSPSSVAHIEAAGVASVPLPLIDHPLGPWLEGTGRQLDARPELGALHAERLLDQATQHLEDFLVRTGKRMTSLDASKRLTRLELLRRVEIARGFLHATPSRTVLLDELARHAGLSPFYLARCFRAVHGKPPATYHRDWRLDRAALQLAGQHEPCGHVAVANGFADQAGFIRAFVRRFGLTPGRYKLMS